MAPAFLSADAVQDDAQQHVFWMLRFRDPELFRDDLFADYFRSLAPPGYWAIYRVLALAIDPLLASKLLPPLLGLVAAVFTFLLVRHLYPWPGAAFLATVLSSWYVWQYDDLASATPRAFLLPTLTALLWALTTRRLVLAVVLTVLGALLYPTAGVLGVALLGVRALAGGLNSRSRSALLRGRLVPFLAATLLVGTVLLPSVVASTPYGPAVGAVEARAMPEFGRHGRNEFFDERPYQFWLESYRSGLNLRVYDAVFPSVPVLFEYAGLAALLPLLLLFRRRLAAARRVDGRAMILVQLLVASFGLFAMAHLLLFRLYLPSRYVQWSVPLVLSIAGGLALAIVFDQIAARVRPAGPHPPAGALALLFAAGLAVYPARYDVGFVRDPHPAITAYLKAQPKDVLVAAIPTAADPLPAMTGRRVLVAREYALAYHLGYYREVRQRIEDLIEAYYDESPRRLARLSERYGVGLVLVDRAAFEWLSFRRVWNRDFEPFTSVVAARLTRPRRYALQDLVRRCAVVDDGRFALIPASCLGGAR